MKHKNRERANDGALGEAPGYVIPNPSTPLRTGFVRNLLFLGLTDYEKRISHSALRAPFEMTIPGRLSLSGHSSR